MATQSVEVGLHLRVSVSYSQIRDVIAHVNEQLGEPLRVGPANLSMLRSYNLTLNSPYRIAYWWSVQISLSIFSNHYEAMIQNGPEPMGT